MLLYSTGSGVNRMQVVLFGFNVRLRFYFDQYNKKLRDQNVLPYKKVAKTSRLKHLRQKCPGPKRPMVKLSYNPKDLLNSGSQYLSERT